MTRQPRFPDIDPDTLPAEGRRVYDAIASGPRGVVQGPLRVWLNSPGLADKAQALGAFCRYGTSLPPRLSELAICTTGAHWQAGFEWHVHAPLAAEAGIAADALEAIRTGGSPRFSKDDEAIVHEFTRELLTTRRVSDATYARSVALLGSRTVVELVGLLGYYALISMTINVFDVPVPDGVPAPFPQP